MGADIKNVFHPVNFVMLTSVDEFWHVLFLSTKVKRSILVHFYTVLQVIGSLQQDILIHHLIPNVGEKTYPSSSALLSLNIDIGNIVQNPYRSTTNCIMHAKKAWSMNVWLNGCVLVITVFYCILSQLRVQGPS